MLELKQTAQLADNLDRLTDAVHLVLPTAQVRAILAGLAAFLALYLMQLMTPMAGWHGVIPLLRLAQRCALAWLALGLALAAVAPFLRIGGFYALIWLILEAALFTLLLASVILVHLGHSSH